jgi:hypothetical protein
VSVRARLTPRATELLDAAFRAVHYARGIDQQYRRALLLERKNGIMDAICAMTGADSESLYEEFSDRLQAYVESATGSE